MTDICARTGLEVPLLQEGTQKEISRLVPEANTSCKNPVDLGFFGFFPQVYGQAIRQTAKDPHIDVLMLYQLTEFFAQFSAEFDWAEEISSGMAQIQQEISKPFVVIIPLLEQDDLGFTARRQALIQKLRQQRIPVFPTAERAAKTLFRLQRYSRFLDRS